MFSWQTDSKLWSICTLGENLLRLMWFPQSLKPGRHDIQKTTCLEWPKGFSFLQKKKKKAIPSGSMIRPVQKNCGYRMPLVEQELLTLQEYLRSPPILSGVHAALCGILLFCFFFLTIVLSVFRFTASG